ncbi:N-formylglutamate amidohydrolase [Reinekea forsetii]|uniref:Putative N-formylglutamate aminohydrolase n=1 Tax=Reinekea forsetii TaxID=1336806 RepID=A0A2K8KQS7_9GAMM|nr:N-formylglutamate amidohydrolase [Reinekea forsetii]ATX77093.1 putative N-formylglutamate aminohydrolase [Reinekea forsetii]
MNDPSSHQKYADTKLPIIAHVPHDSTHIPKEDQVNFLRSFAALGPEINKLTDHFTARLFQSAAVNVQAHVFPVNRFLVDVERFEDDEIEPMAAKGMGALYTHDTQGKRFRARLTALEREDLLNKYYRPHHARLTQLTQEAIARSNQGLIIDAHSFPDRPLPCDDSQATDRPDICLGTDAFHTPDWLIDLVRVHFEQRGYQVELNSPYSGTMVPLGLYKKDNRLNSIMIEINRRLYLDDAYQINDSGFTSLRSCITDLYRLITIEAVVHRQPTQ